MTGGDVRRVIIEVAELLIVEAKGAFADDEAQIVSFLRQCLGMQNLAATVLRAFLDKFFRAPAAKSKGKQFCGVAAQLVLWDLLFAPPERTKGAEWQAADDAKIVNEYKALLIDAVFGGRCLCDWKLQRLTQIPFSAADQAIMWQACKENSSSESLDPFERLQMHLQKAAKGTPSK